MFKVKIHQSKNRVNFEAQWNPPMNSVFESPKKILLERIFKITTNLKSIAKKLFICISKSYYQLGITTFQSVRNISTFLSFFCFRLRIHFYHGDIIKQAKESNGRLDDPTCFRFLVRSSSRHERSTINAFLRPLFGSLFKWRFFVYCNWGRKNSDSFGKFRYGSISPFHIGFKSNVKI